MKVYKGIRIVFSDFLDWLQRFGDVIIVVDYGLGFDFIVMNRVLCFCDLKDRFDVIGGVLCDLINIIREKNFGFENMYRDLLYGILWFYIQYL